MQVMADDELEIGEPIVAAHQQAVAKEEQAGRVGQRLGQDGKIAAPDARAKGQVAERTADGDIGQRHVDAGAPGLFGQAGGDRGERSVDLDELPVDPRLAALLGDKIIAVGRYERAPGTETTVE